MDSMTPVTEPAPSSSRGERAFHAISLASALLTIITFLKDATEVVDFMVHNMLLSGGVCLLLLMLFTGELVPRLASKIGELILQLFHFFDNIRLKFSTMKLLTLSRLGIVGLAAIVILFAAGKVYLSGVYYIILESSTEEIAIHKRVTILNNLLADQAWDGPQIEAAPPLGRSKYFAITIGPIFNKQEAQDTFERLKQLLGVEVRPDAGVRRVTLANVWRKAKGIYE